MALPKLQIPEYELVVPSTQEKIKYRPFLVKEEKILLLAMESENDSQINEAPILLVSVHLELLMAERHQFLIWSMFFFKLEESPWVKLSS
jgi:hypothetical protein